MNRYRKIPAFISLLLLVLVGVSRAQDTNYVKQLLDTAFQYERSDYDKSKRAAETALVLSQKVGFNKGISQAYRQLGLLHYDKSEYDKAVDLFLKSLAIAEKNNFPDEKARVYLHLGLVYLDKVEYDKALAYFSDGKKICEQYGLKKGLPYYMTNIAIVYDLRGKYPEAIRNYIEVLQLMKQEKNKQGMANVENDIGNVYKHQHNYATAKKHYLEALAMLKEMNDIYIAVTYGNIAEVSADMKQYGESLQYLDSAIAAARQFNSPKIIRSCYEKKAAVYERMNDYRSAFYYGKRVKELQDSIFSEESERNIAEMQTRYETDKKESENRLLRQENELNELKIEESRKKTIYLFAGLGLALLLLGVAFYAYRIKIRTNNLLEEQNAQINRQNDTLKKLNLQLIENEEELQASNTAKDRLLSVISHDISNPVKALSNYTQAILSRREQMSREEIATAFTQVHHAVTPLQNMVENLLNWSYVQKNGFSVNKKQTVLAQLVNECVFIYRQAAETKRIDLSVHINENSVVEADPDMLLLIVRNLLNNAIKFTAPGGSVEVNYDPERRQLLVTDTGTGMGAETISALLNGTGHHSLKGIHAESGTGMGLQLVRDCIQAQGFRWNIASTPGKGTTVEICF